MSDFADWWLADNAARDRRLRKKLEAEIQDVSNRQAQQAQAAATAQSRELRSRLAELQGTLEQRMDRMAKAFDAFVELSDVQTELAMFEEEITVRNAARRLTRALARRVGDPADGADIRGLPQALPRCPGYWLRPAVASLAAAAGADGSGTDGSAALAEARGLDPVRTDTFLAAGLGLAGRVAEALPLLENALGAPGPETTYARRALWTACLHGVYGDQGEELIRAWLSGYARALAPEQADGARQAWEDAARVALGAEDLAKRARDGLPYPLNLHDELIQPLIAGQQLVALSSLVSEMAAGEPTRPGEAASGSGAAAVTAGLAATMIALAEEGSGEEIGLRGRARELREVIDDRKTALRPAWNTAAGQTLALLSADSLGGDPRQRRVALTVCGPWAIGLASRLADSAAVTPPGQVGVNLDGRIITVDASGNAVMDEAYAEIEANEGPRNMSDKLFHRKDLNDEVARQKESLAVEARAAAHAFRDRVIELRALAGRARADCDSIASVLAQDE